MLLLSKCCLPHETFLFQVFFCISIFKCVFCSDFLKPVHFLIRVKIVNLPFKTLKSLISTVTIHIFELRREALLLANLPKEFADEKMFPAV